MRTKEEHAKYMREYNKLPHVKEKVKARNLAYKEKRRAELSQKERERYYANHEQELIKRQQYREANREAIREKHRIYSKTWRENNKEKIKAQRDKCRVKPEQQIKRREIKARRRAIEKETSVERIDYNRIIEQSNMMCGICKQSIGDKWHFDHIIPLSAGGTHTFDNIQLAHPVCNLSKNKALIFPAIDAII
jgi:5-methylcytosine-specific restriction endonuclease McrA